jgi:DNA polymerase III subunit delta'
VSTGALESVPSPSSRPSIWDRLAGQDHAVDQLRRAAERPVHAYLLVGARGSGVEDAARCFGASLVASEEDERAVDLALRGMHPDVVEFEPEAANYRVKEDVRERIIPEASRSPVEGPRKVVVLFEAERLKGNRWESANALLKTIEEPPPRTVMVLVTSTPDELTPTVLSRCQRIDLAPLSDAAVRAALEREGVASDRAELAASLAGGQLGRARALAGPDLDIRDAFVSAVTYLDGRGASAMQAAELLAEELKQSVSALEVRQAEEAETLSAELESAGYPDRSRAALMTRLADRHKREHRAARRRALGEGIAAIESLYRDSLGTDRAPRRNLDRTPPAVAASEAALALEACRSAREALERNPNEGLLLDNLVLALPASVERSPISEKSVLT